MTISMRSVAFALGILAASASVSKAGTMCLDSGTDAATRHQFVVFKGFSKPAKGSCRLLAGYEASTSTPIPASATACLNAAGDRLYVGLIVHPFSKEGPPMIHVFSLTTLGFDFP